MAFNLATSCCQLLQQPVADCQRLSDVGNQGVLQKANPRPIPVQSPSNSVQLCPILADDSQLDDPQKAGLPAEER